MSEYSQRRGELARTRRWAPYAVMRREVLDLAIELLEVRPGDVVVDLGCDLYALRDALSEECPSARVLDAFGISEIRYPEPDESEPPDVLDVDLMALTGWAPEYPTKVFGTFVDEPTAGLVGQALSLLAEDGSVRWGRFIGALVARYFCSGGRAVVVVRAGDLDVSSLAEARRRLVSAGLVERALLLPLDAMVGRRVTTALLVLSEGNATVGVTDLSGTAPGAAGRRGGGLTVEGALAAMRSEDPSLNRTLRCCDLASGECRLGAAALRLPDADLPVLRVGDLAEVFAGENVSRAPGALVGAEALEPPPDGDRYARAVGPGDFDHGELVAPRPPRAGDRFVPVSGVVGLKLLRRGDVVVPRASSSFSASVVGDDLDPTAGVPLLATHNLVVVRPRDGVDPYYLAALLNSPAGVATTLRGGPIRHTGVRDVALIPVPEWHERRGEMQRIGEWYRRAVEGVRRRRRDLLDEEEVVARGLESLASHVPW